ncbi:MAG TPA: cytidine deaminase [Marinilabiliales bacterium]|nr:cytidine deaminase [Marinilabiliales bacterium]HBO73229.1 cytidine deaminase [Marinilabiliales bacterium]HBX85224.1 cytidine deaminase [Marinilabiliales bacterium]HBY54662.1 cytidine deaminase [Marinilabiliales bacterium]HCC30945.1 cytidine deaminase [Marinilabiliales bacterium]
MKKEHITTVYEYDSAADLSSDLQKIIIESKEAALRAYAPYSNFNVGAAVLLSNGEVFSGNNQENAAYPSGLCAERVAIFYANSKYPNVPVLAIAICAFNKNGILKTPVPPCGSCRQVLLESEIRFKTPIKIILVAQQTIQIIENVSELLPLSFQKDNLFE